MNIIESINYSYGLKYYGLEDLSIGWEIKFLIENKESILDYFNSKNITSIDNLDEYLDYLWLSKFREIDEAIPLLKNEEDKPLLKSIHTQLLGKYKEYNIGMIIKYLCNNFQEVFESNRDNHYYHDMKRATVDFIYGYANSFSNDAFDYLETNYWYLIVDNFEQYSVFYKKHLKRFNDNIINDIIAVENIKNYDRVFKILEITKKEPFEQFTIGVAETVCNHVLEMVESINEDNYIEVSLYLDKAKKIALLYKLKEVYKFQKLDSKLIDISNSYFEKHGHKFETEPIDLQKAVVDLKDGKNPSIIKFLEFTHTFDRESKLFKPIYNKIMTEPKATFDHINHIGIPEDEYFYPSRLTNLGMYFDIYTKYLFVCFKDEDLRDDIVSNYYNILSNLVKEDILSEEDLEEYLGMCNVFSSLLTIDEEGNVKKSLTYGVSMLIVVYIEKFLRKYFTHLHTKETYINVSRYTLNMLMNEQEIQNVFGEHVSKVLEYQLTKKRATDIGLNLRNNLMHNIGIDFRSMNIGYPVRAFYCLILLLNVIATKYIKIDDR